MALLVSGSGLASAQQLAVGKPLGPAEAIQLAERYAPDPVPGTFRLDIRHSGKDKGIVFLNTEQDYRDPRCVSVELLPDVAKKLGKRLDGKPAKVLIGKTLLVTGEVRRVPIILVDINNKRRLRSGLEPLPAYYQVHVFVRNADQIQVLEAPAAP